MAQVFSTMLFVVACLGALEHGLASFLRLTAASGELAEAWHEEYALRLCGALAARQANLDASALLVASIVPRLGEQARTEGEQLVQALRLRYPDARPAPCRSEALGLAAPLHLQQHPGQPRFWPNWLARFVLSDQAP